MTIPTRILTDVENLSLGDIPISWKVKPLEEIASYRKEKINPLKTSVEYKYVALENIEQGSGKLSGISSSLNTTSTKSCFKEGDTLFNKLRPYLNKYWFASFEGVCATELLPLIPSRDTYPKFLYYCVQQEKVLGYVTNRTFGTKMPRTSWNELKEILIPVPPFEEQQKIAEILTSADEQIEKTRQLIEKTKELKIGLMQQLLTKGIEHFSFKKTVVGEIPETWNVYKIKDVALKVTDGEHKTPSRIESGELLLSARNIQNGRIDYSNVDYISEDELNKITKRCHPEMGDILLSCSGSVGRVCIVPGNIKFGLVRSVALIKIDEEVLSSKFLMYMLQSPLLQKQMEMKQSKLAQANLFLRDINSLIIPFPSLEEQLEISKIISSVDEQLNVYEKEKEKQIELKKALMQQLLTGKIRVTF